MSLSHFYPAVLIPVHCFLSLSAAKDLYFCLFFSYYDFPPMFRAEMFDPDHWASVFSKAGAKCTVHSVHSVTMEST